MYHSQLSRSDSYLQLVLEYNADYAIEEHSLDTTQHTSRVFVWVSTIFETLSFETSSSATCH
jgi:hypothetical protein